MGSRAIPVNALPRLTLTHEDRAEYKALADESVRETLTAYEEFLYVQQRQVDTARWKLLKEKEDVHVYRERSAAAASSSSTTTTSSSKTSHRARRKTVEIGPKASMAANSTIPLFLVNGTVQGTIDDAMYGSYADDTSSLRRRSTYMRDLMEDQTILDTLEGPTMDDPFNHLSIVWMLRDFPGLGAVVKRRDFFMLSKTGTTTTSRGERIGYCLMHSIQHRDLPEFDAASVIRAKTSFCLMFREVEADRLDVFNQTVSDPGGNVMSFLVLQEAASTLLTCGKAMNCANKKKLFYFMRKQARALSASTMGGAAVSSPASNSSHSSASSTAAVVARFQSMQRHHQESDTCASCEKSLGKLFSKSGTWCQLCQRVCSSTICKSAVDAAHCTHCLFVCLCFQMVCSRCVVKKKIVIEATDKKLVFKPFEFCIVCTLTVKNSSARHIHMEELRGQRWALA